MPRYEVTVKRTEVWEVEAESEDEAGDDYMNGNLIEENADVDEVQCLDPDEEALDAELQESLKHLRSVQ